VVVPEIVWRSNHPRFRSRRWAWPPKYVITACHLIIAHTNVFLHPSFRAGRSRRWLNGHGGMLEAPAVPSLRGMEACSAGSYLPPLAPAIGAGAIHGLRHSLDDGLISNDGGDAGSIHRCRSCHGISPRRDGRRVNPSPPTLPRPCSRLARPSRLRPRAGGAARQQANENREDNYENLEQTIAGMVLATTASPAPTRAAEAASSIR